ncbi:hypothetical protein DFH27DRAFT_524716 [Peziza echinospora]|nr:hypothetical protein DFH27DRAFT_524716 [Peziza echinospora]
MPPQLPLLIVSSDHPTFDPDQLHHLTEYGYRITYLHNAQLRDYQSLTDDIEESELFGIIAFGAPALHALHFATCPTSPSLRCVIAYYPPAVPTKEFHPCVKRVLVHLPRRTHGRFEGSLGGGVGGRMDVRWYGSEESSNSNSNVEAAGLGSRKGSTTTDTADSNSSPLGVSVGFAEMARGRMNGYSRICADLALSRDLDTLRAAGLPGVVQPGYVVYPQSSSSHSQSQSHSLSTTPPTSNSSPQSSNNINTTITSTASTIATTLGLQRRNSAVPPTSSTSTSTSAAPSTSPSANLLLQQHHTTPEGVWQEFIDYAFSSLPSPTSHSHSHPPSDPEKTPITLGFPRVPRSLERRIPLKDLRAAVLGAGFKMLLVACTVGVNRVADEIVAVFRLTRNMAVLFGLSEEGGGGSGGRRRRRIRYGEQVEIGMFLVGETRGARVVGVRITWDERELERVGVEDVEDVEVVGGRSGEDGDDDDNDTAVDDEARTVGRRRTPTPTASGTGTGFPRVPTGAVLRGGTTTTTTIDDGVGALAVD